MRKKIKNIITFGILIASTSIMTETASAKTIQTSLKNGNFYSINLSNTSSAYQYLDTLGVAKRTYTTPTITISKTETRSFSMSTEISGTVKSVFLDATAKEGICYSSTKSVYSGQSITINANASPGIYYGAISQIAKKATIKKYEYNGSQQPQCIGSYTVKFAPIKGSAYLDVRKRYNL